MKRERKKSSSIHLYMELDLTEAQKQLAMTNARQRK